MSLPERKGGRGDLGRKAIEFTDQDIREAARLLALIANTGSSRLEDLLRAPGPSVADNQLDRDVLLARVRRHLSNRRLRTSYFNRAIFGEPAWDMLLVLYITEFAGGRQSVRRLADWVGTPVSTALRWINYLAKERLVQKEAHPNDRRMTFVTLLDKGRGIIESYFSSISE